MAFWMKKIANVYLTLTKSLSEFFALSFYSTILYNKQVYSFY